MLKVRAILSALPILLSLGAQRHAPGGEEAAPPAPSRERIDQAVAKARDYLLPSLKRSRGVSQEKDAKNLRQPSSSASDSMDEGDDIGLAALGAVYGSEPLRLDRRPTGREMLAAYALLKCEVKPTEEPLESLLETLSAEIRKAPFQNTYDAGVACLLLSETEESRQRYAPPKKAKKKTHSSTKESLQILSDAIVQGQLKSGGWGYLVGKQVKPDAHSDDHLSTTQYALLGLRAAANHGARIPADAWSRALTFLLDSQCAMDDERSEERGGWGYARKGHKHFGSYPAPYGSMTAAGVASVRICLQGMRDKPGVDGERARKAMDLGIAWLARRFTAKEHAGVLDAYGEEHVEKGTFLHYYLYSIERTGAFAEIERIGGHDWYREGCEELLRSQEKDGSWLPRGSKCRGAESAPIATSFAVLFLTRSSRSIAAPKYAVETDPPGER